MKAFSINTFHGYYSDTELYTARNSTRHTADAERRIERTGTLFVVAKYWRNVYVHSSFRLLYTVHTWI